MRFHRGEEEDYRPELTPLVDVIFQLIIFFMVSTVFVDFTKQIPLELPVSQTGETLGQAKHSTIEITLDERILLDGKVLTRDELKDQLQAGGKRAVVIRADKRLPYGQVVRIIEICQSVGITDIGVAVQ